MNEPTHYVVTEIPRDTVLNPTYDYSSVPEPVPGIEPGTILPEADFPADPICPFCEDKPKFKTSPGLRGHAHGKHGIRWALPPKREIQQLPDWNSFVRPDERETLEPWMITAISMHEIYGLTWVDLAERFGKSAGTMSQYGSSPAGLALRKRIHEMFEEPEKVAKMLLQASSINASADYLLAMSWAREAEDYEALARMAKDLMKMGGLDEADNRDRAQTIQVFIAGGRASLETPAVPTSFQIAEVIDEEPNS